MHSHNAFQFLFLMVQCSKTYMHTELCLYTCDQLLFLVCSSAHDVNCVQ